MVVSERHTEPSTKRRRCLVGEERKLGGDEEVHNKRPNATIFIGGLHPRIVQAHLEKMCLPYGSIQRLHFCDRKGYAFCQYATPEQAEAALQALDGRGLLGRRLMVRPAHSDQPKQATLSGSQPAASSNSHCSSNPDKERERIEARIQAVKRKLQDTTSG
jgi:RNA recognition motif-containing protein